MSQSVISLNASRPPRLRPGYTTQSDPANLARKPYDDSRVLQEDHTQQPANSSLRTYYSSFQTVGWNHDAGYSVADDQTKRAEEGAQVTKEDYNVNYVFVPIKESQTSRVATSVFKLMHDAIINDVIIFGCGFAGATCCVSPGGGCWLRGQLMRLDALDLRKLKWLPQADGTHFCEMVGLPLCPSQRYKIIDAHSLLLLL
ncbi:unnamed protein product [Tilletia caries]|nr:unnamed protein product [Tilletia caries]